jgi:hypothetical protein
MKVIARKRRTHHEKAIEEAKKMAKLGTLKPLKA